ncbi:MAG: cell division protein FtsZ [bacterium]|nr:cell division protein FtsZ [bacterium]
MDVPAQPFPQVAPEDREVLEFYEKAKAKIKVVGIGGAGCNTISRLFDMGIEGVELIAMNTDAQHLLYTKAHRKLILGKKLCRGLGAGNDPTKGREAAKESAEEIRKYLEGTDLLFITCGLGGGTGTGGAPVVAEIAKELGILTVCVVTLPFTVEGLKRRKNAEKAYNELLKVADTVIKIKNDKLLELEPDLPVNQAFKKADEILASTIKNIVEIITKSELINVDFADVRTVLEHGGVGAVGFGEVKEGPREDRARVVVEQVLNNPLLDVRIDGARKALVNIIGDRSLRLEEVQQILEAISSKLHPEAEIIPGAHHDESVPEGYLKVWAVITGIEEEKKGYELGIEQI